MKWVRKGIRLYEAANRGQIDLLASNLEYFGGLQSVFSQNSKKPIRTTIPSERISSVDCLHSDLYKPNQQSSASFQCRKYFNLPLLEQRFAQRNCTAVLVLLNTAKIEAVQP